MNKSEEATCSTLSKPYPCLGVLLVPFGLPAELQPVHPQLQVRLELPRGPLKDEVEPLNDGGVSNGLLP